MCFFKLAVELLFAWIIFLLKHNLHVNAKFFSLLSFDSKIKISEYAGHGVLHSAALADVDVLACSVIVLKVWL